MHFTSTLCGSEPDVARAMRSAARECARRWTKSRTIGIQDWPDDAVVTVPIKCEPDMPLGGAAATDAPRPYQFREVFLFAFAKSVGEKPRSWLPALSEELLVPRGWCLLSWMLCPEMPQDPDSLISFLLNIEKCREDVESLSYVEAGRVVGFWDVIESRLDGVVKYWSRACTLRSHESRQEVVAALANATDEDIRRRVIQAGTQLRGESVKALEARVCELSSEVVRSFASCNRDTMALFF